VRAEDAPHDELALVVEPPRTFEELCRGRRVLAWPPEVVESANARVLEDAREQTLRHSAARDR
jgi:hypothetical protein